MGAERCGRWGAKNGCKKRNKVLESGMSPEQVEGEQFLQRRSWVREGVGGDQSPCLSGSTLCPVPAVRWVCPALTVLSPGSPPGPARQRQW